MPRFYSGGVELANKFSLYRPEGAVRALDAENFVAAFLLHLLHHREKIDQRHLEFILPAEVRDTWRNLLQTLEDRNRKLIDAQQGSVLLTFFCPSLGSKQQLRSEEWTRNMKHCFMQLLTALGKFLLRLC